ncbi:class D sortase [Halobacillus amylolyticus]|uniref:Class D sortase n=1 Tax=Halobacillus amylolyticus TaxID=2932259 RepID=A0ABY4H7L4_9BACI|nr:class D sortase [Halobacillus amylolyticus]UOR10855.1 class D sortase [Halobacillus amylolyticus]
MKKIGIVISVLGLGLVVWSGYGWWKQTTVVTHDTSLAQSVDEEWDQTAEQQTLQVEDVAASQSGVTTKYDKGEEVGEFVIPKLGTVYPVYWGTNQAALQKGVGMYDTAFTTVPSAKRHTALAGHRDTTFRNLDQLAEGDRLYVKVDEVKYEYQVRETWVTDAEDRSVIVEKEKPTLTLTTCYPFDYIGSAPDRYIVQAELIGQEKMNGN